MKYALLIYEDEANWEKATPEEGAAIMLDYFRYTDQVREAGIDEGGEALQPTGTATTVRVRDGETLSTDGPFAETKEQLGGFYVIEAENLDEAISWAARIPGARTGSIEVRPVMAIPPREAIEQQAAAGAGASRPA